MDRARLKDLARTFVELGELPNRLVSAFRGGTGQHGLCRLCEMPVTQHQVCALIDEAHFAEAARWHIAAIDREPGPAAEDDAGRMRFHILCFHAWQAVVKPARRD